MLYLHFKGTYGFCLPKFLWKIIPQDGTTVSKGSLYRNLDVGFGRAKSVSVFRRLYRYSDLHCFLRSKSFRFGAAWSFSILYINIDLYFAIFFIY
jgi:hypothetical protein